MEELLFQMRQAKERKESNDEPKDSNNTHTESSTEPKSYEETFDSDTQKVRALSSYIYITVYWLKI